MRSTYFLAHGVTERSLMDPCHESLSQIASTISNISFVLLNTKINTSLWKHKILMFVWSYNNEFPSSRPFIQDLWEILMQFYMCSRGYLGWLLHWQLWGVGYSGPSVSLLHTVGHSIYIVSRANLPQPQNHGNLLNVFCRATANGYNHPWIFAVTDSRLSKYIYL